MTDFDALLKRSFAEAHEPADDGFTARVEHAVERREAAIKTRTTVHALGLATAGAAVAYGCYALFGTFGEEMLASAGIEVARAHGALSSAPSVGGAAQGLMQSLSAGLTQALLMVAALAGGAVAYRVSQD